ncbi:hypothetical protein NW762_005450 [Fusarium torreyae]|uniref:Zn(2)-C6 fungal-type domain-containing protein n=1 Tax=Fusarium torreyae TaxID=1237075 RepID=A0A9W8S457_9HYPO|nr:hypothetical protein NW762_005450 [Fusarium torreyae]
MPPQACDACKRRKVKCDSTQPCGTCRVSNISCRYTTVPRKRGPKVARRAEGIEVSPRSMDFRQDQLGDRHLQDQSHTPTSTNGGSDYSSREWSSPDTVRVYSPGLEASNLIQPTSSKPQLVWGKLLNSISTALPSIPILDLVDSCIDTYLQYSFPICPIIHEPSLRRYNRELFSPQSTPFLFASTDEYEQVIPMRAFTELAALCAAVCSITPSALLPGRNLAVHPFLEAARDMLHLYEDFDLEYPDSSSLFIRLFLSSCLQHTTGKTGASWSIFSQAAVLVRRMRLYDEKAVIRNDPVETYLLRSRFWQLYVSDQAATLMQNRVVVLRESLLEGELTLDSLGGHVPDLLDTENARHQNSFQQRILSTHELLKRLWFSAADLMTWMQKYARDQDIYEKKFQESQKSRMVENFLRFTSMVDDLPPWLESPTSFEFSDDKDVLSYQRTSFIVQRSAVMLGFHCWRLVLIERAVEYKLTDIVGLYDQELAIAMKKTEVIHDFLSEAKTTPLLCIQAQGEPMVGITMQEASLTSNLLDNLGRKVQESW